MANKTKVTAEPGKQEIFTEREFEAPRELVFRLLTDAELMPQWWGPRDLSMRIDKLEPRTNGSYRFLHTDPKGMEYGFHGVIHEVLPPERIIQTFEFEGLPETGHVILETFRLTALPGDRTRLVIQSVFQSVGDRDGMIQSGMEKGVRESHERMDELLARGF